MENIIENLKNKQTRSTTNDTYLRIWRQFNRFIIRLDVKPKTWEERTSLFLADLVNGGMKSQSVKTYISAIKKTLLNDGYQWDDKKILLGVLIRSSKLINDKVITRLPIGCNLLELILFELERKFPKQYYLETMYKALFLMGYYGLMRIGELSVAETNQHTLKAKNVHMATNKEKLLLILYSSKTHGAGQLPQKIKITSVRSELQKSFVHRYFCPFTCVRKFITI